MSKPYTLKIHKLQCMIADILGLFDEIDNPADFVAYKIRYEEFQKHKFDLQNILRDMLWVGEEIDYDNIKIQIVSIRQQIISKISLHNETCQKRNTQKWRG